MEDGRGGGREDGRGTVRGDEQVDGRRDGGDDSLATQQTPQIDNNTPARGCITMHNGV